MHSLVEWAGHGDLIKTSWLIRNEEDLHPKPFRALTDFQSALPLRQITFQRWVQGDPHSRGSGLQDFNVATNRRSIRTRSSWYDRYVTSIMGKLATPTSR